MINKLQYISTPGFLDTNPENLQVKSMKNNFVRKIPRSIKIFFVILHFVFGQDFGFGNLFGKKTSEFLKYYSAVLTLSIFVILVLPFKSIGQHVWYWCALVECMTNFYILKSAKYNVYNFLCDVHAAESIAVLEKETFGAITAVYAIVMFMAKVLEFGIYCLFDNNIFCAMNRIYLILYAISCHAVDLMYETLIVVRFYIYGYVKNMERSLKQDQDINKFIERYNRIVDYQDKIRRISDCFTVLELINNVPKLMGSLWYVLIKLKTEFSWFVAISEFVIAFHLSIQLIIPAIIMQLIKYRLDNIRQLLNKWSMVERGTEKNAKIVHVMKYMKRRSLHYEIWGIIPTDLRLPLALISICTTYLIAIVQFTHLYD